MSRRGWRARRRLDRMTDFGWSRPVQAGRMPVQVQRGEKPANPRLSPGRPGRPGTFASVEENAETGGEPHENHISTHGLKKSLDYLDYLNGTTNGAAFSSPHTPG